MDKKKALALLLLLDDNDERMPKSRSCWVREELTRRGQHGEFATWVKEEMLNAGAFHAFFRMTPGRFEELLEVVGPHLLHKRTNCRDPIPADERLAMTLRYLASGMSQKDVARYFRVGQSTIGMIIREVCNCLWQVLSPSEMCEPTQDQWKRTAEQFMHRWNFPNCLGAIDGKHVQVQCPQLSGSAYFNFKSTFSTVLLAAVDADYCFLYIDVGSYGSESDGSVFALSALGRRLAEGTLDLPPPPGDGLQYVFVGDEAFPLKTYLMRPFPGRGMTTDTRYRRLVLNYRLSRARRVVENAFGILVAKWRVFRQPIIAGLDTVDAIVKGTCVLHNYLRRRDGTSTDQLPYVDCGDLDSEQDGTVTSGAWRREATGALQCPGRLSSNNATRDAMDLRERFADFFLSPEGAVPWQNRVVRRGSQAH